MKIIFQIVNVTRTGDVKFCKAFWAIAENDLIHVSLDLLFPLTICFCFCFFLCNFRICFFVVMSFIGTYFNKSLFSTIPTEIYDHSGFKEVHTETETGTYKNGSYRIV